MKNKSFLIAGMCIRFVSDREIEDSEYFPLFRVSDETEPDVVIHVITGPLPCADGNEVFRTNHRRQVVSGGMVYNYTCFSDAAILEHVPYACELRQRDRIELYVDYAPGLWDTMLFDAVDLADIYLEHGSAVVHASLVDYQGQGILFAGPKQTGKSTQAALWEKHKNAVIVNGDRVILRNEGTGFAACGIPFCGSSHVCLNRERPVKAIVFPVKGPENQLQRLTKFESFKRLIGCFTYTETSIASQKAAFELAERIVNACDCYLLSCRADENAVTILAKELDPD